jgi:hypothetical protein
MSEEIPYKSMSNMQLLFDELHEGTLQAGILTVWNEDYKEWLIRCLEDEGSGDGDDCDTCQMIMDKSELKMTKEDFAFILECAKKLIKDNNLRAYRIERLIKRSEDRILKGDFDEEDLIIIKEDES